MTDSAPGSSRVRTAANARAVLDDPRRHARISELFLQAIDLDDSARRSLLDRECRDDESLRAEIDELIRRDAAAAVVDRPIAENTQIAALVQATPALPRVMPQAIGHYEIVDVLGRGGMGTVYRARQHNPSRIVALKVVNPGLWSESASRRFQFEAEFLAKLHHPNIAQVYEAGTAEITGISVPFIAMELVDGVRLTEYATQRKLGVRERLELLIILCDAVQHAHQRGVIHRDLKPANILVDSTGQPKILDFGVARLDAAAGDAISAHTATGELVGTLPYMSPEQVAGKPDDVDTRSDQYALGVIAYELLAGSLPLNVTAGIADAIRTIRDDEPARLGSLNRVYRGDIETIIGKALSKHKERRYASVADFAADLERYLRNEPIVARPVSFAEQFSKFARRHRALVVGVAATMLALAIGVVGTTYGLLRARAERDDAIEARLSADVARQSEESARKSAEKQAAIAKAVNKVLGRMFDSANPLGDVANARPDMTVRELLERESARIDTAFPDQPLLEANVRTTIGVAFKNLARYDDAEKNLRRAVDLFQKAAEAETDPGATARALRELAGLTVQQGHTADGIRLFREALELERKASGADDVNAALGEARLAWAYMQDQNFAEAEPLLRHCIAVCGSAQGAEAAEAHASATHNLALVKRKTGDNSEALRLYEQARELIQKLYGDAYPTLASIESNTAMILIDQQQFAEAERRLRSAIAMRERSFGESHPQVADVVNNLALLLADLGRYDEAVALQRRAVGIHQATYGECHPDFLLSLANLAAILGDADRWSEAAAVQDEVRAAYRTAFGPDHWRTHYSECNYARALVEVGLFDQAERILTTTYARLAEARPLPSNHTRAAARALIRLYERTDRAELAAELHDQLDRPR